MIKLNCPIVPNVKKYISLIEKINENGWYTNFGPMHEELTNRLSSYLGVQNLLLVSNGTLALQIAYETLGVRRAITTPYSFVATASTLAWQNKEILYSDVDENNGNISFEKTLCLLNENENYDSVVATHVFGNPCEVNKFNLINKKINIIYDAAHAFGVKIDGESVLNYGDASTISFHATKVFHTIEGGGIVFKKKEHFDEAKRMINFGIELDKGIKSIGINAKLNEYQAAAGLVFLDDLDEILERRVELFELYRRCLYDIIDMPKWLDQASLNGAYMPIFCKNENELISMMNNLEKKGIQTRRYFYPSLNNVIKANQDSNTMVSDALAKRSLCLPLHYYMTKEEVLVVVDAVKSSLS